MFKTIKKLLSSITVKLPNYSIEVAMPVINNQAEERRERNELTLAQANLELSRNAYQAQVDMTHRMFIVSFLALIVAIAALIVAIVR